MKNPDENFEQDGGVRPFQLLRDQVQSWGRWRRRPEATDLAIYLQPSGDKLNVKSQFIKLPFFTIQGVLLHSKWMVWLLVLITLPKILRKDWSISRELRFFTQKMVTTVSWIKLREWHSNRHSPQPRALTKKRRQSEVLLPFRGSTADRLNELCSMGVGVGSGAHTKGIRESDEERDEEADTTSENKVQKNVSAKPTPNF